MRVRFRPQARLEALQARDWYEARTSGLGLEFARSLDIAIAAAARDPEAYPLAHGECRQILLRRFPYSLIYRARVDELLVLAVFHHRRHPSSLSRRIDR